MNQHYVPRVYLKNFAEKRKGNFYIDVYDKLNHRFFNTNTKNVCSEKNLYTLPKESKVSNDELYIEKYYSDIIEPSYQRCYEILTNDNISIINPMVRFEILIGLLQLYSRNPFLLRNKLIKQRTEITTLLKESKPDSDIYLKFKKERYKLTLNTIDEVMTKIGEKLFIEFKEKNIQSISQIGNFHKNAVIIVDKLRDESKFITSDNPVPIEDGLTENSNPLLRSKMFYIPLNSKYCVRISHDRHKDQNKIYRTNSPNGVAHTLNQKIIEQSNQFVFCCQGDLQHHKKQMAVFDNVNIDTIMDVIRQAIELGPHPTEFELDNGSRDVLQSFLDRYNKNGTLSLIEQKQLAEYMRSTAKRSIFDRIKK